MDSVSIVIPALNEEGVVGRTIRSIDVDELKKLGLAVEVIVVDNGSTDNTGVEAGKAGAKVILEERRGYGTAYMRGFEESRGDIIVMADADGSYPLDRTSEFIKPILDGEADFVIGSRLRGEILPGAMPWSHRYVGNPLLSFSLNRLFKANISDAHCGMRAFTREALHRMNLKTPGMEFASEMVIEATRKKMRIVEVPIEYRPRGGGEAKLSSFQDGWRHMRFMLLYSPTVIFVAPGFILFVIGGFLTLLLARGPTTVVGFKLDIHPMLLGNLLLILGFQVIILGLFAKTYAVIHNMVEPGRLTKFFLRYHSLEYELLVGGIIFLIGVLIDLRILTRWITTGFGALSELRNAILASTLAVLGFQMIFAAWFMSVLLLEKREENELG